MKVLDLFSGLGGFSKAFKDRGHEVIQLDCDPQFSPDICMDVMEFEPEGYYDIILASPPCNEFSRESMPWIKTGVKPGLYLVERAKEIIENAYNEWWVIENVRGAVKWVKPILGDPVKRVGSRYLWGEFPIFDAEHVYGKEKLFPSPNRAAVRSLIPYPLSLNLCIACERELRKGAFFEI